jgi:sucrose phosphorylase
MKNKIKNKIQLITYPDSFGKNLKELEFILDKHFKNVVSGVHILPFYPSSGDRGFSPLTHLEVDPSFGSWEDIRSLSDKYDVMADLMVNHISAESVFFQDYLEKGKLSDYADYFITSDKFSRRIKPQREKTPFFLELIERFVNLVRNMDKFFHTFGVNKFSLKKIYRPRPENPFVPFVFGDGTVRHIWCTFTNNQIDLDVHNQDVKNIFKGYIKKLAENGVDIIRLDAVGYMVKKRGTTSFMIPETKKAIDWLGNECHKNKVLSLPEIHNHYSYQVEMSNMEEVDLVYDFQLPLLVLEAILNSSCSNLKKWIRIRPTDTVNALDTHDGIPVVDVEDLLSREKIDIISDRIISGGGNEAKRASGNNGAENVDNYILARAVQFFIPGIPQVYYVGLLAGENDIEKLKRTNIGRDINRHNYSLDEIESNLNKDVVKRLIKLMEFRNSYPVFDGEFSLGPSKRDKLILRWRKNNLFLEAKIDLTKKEVRVHYLDNESLEEKEVVF